MHRGQRSGARCTHISLVAHLKEHGDDGVDRQRNRSSDEARYQHVSLAIRVGELRADAHAVGHLPVKRFVADVQAQALDARKLILQLCSQQGRAHGQSTGAQVPASTEAAGTEARAFGRSGSSTAANSVYQSAVSARIGTGAMVGSPPQSSVSPGRGKPRHGCVVSGEQPSSWRTSLQQLLA